MSDADSTAPVRYAKLARYPDHRFGTDGSVWFFKNDFGEWEPVKLYVITGYPAVYIGKKVSLVHRLILEAFAGPCPPGMEACHDDGDRSNASIGNLRWDTHSENERDKARHGRSNTPPRKVGSKNLQSKLTEKDVHDIWEQIAAGRQQQHIAEEYGVSDGTISNIRVGRLWSHVSSERILTIKAMLG